jgi:4-hydroxybenzoate polyprenyltransferase
MNPYFRLMRLNKPVGIYLLLWPTLWALFLAAGGWPSTELISIFVAGVVLMRSAGCVINDYADRKIDYLVQRTKHRPITSGEILASKALLLFSGLIMIAFGLVLLTNPLTIKLAFIAAFLATLYPFTKRWTHLPQFVLGASFAMSVPMAFSATNGEVPVSAWWIFAATLIWTVIYDTMYAMSDRDEDLKIGVKSTAILFAQYDRIILAGLQVGLVIVLLKISQIFEIGVYYDISVFLSALLMIYHQILIKNREKSACIQAFLHNNYIGMVIFIGIVLSVTQ